MTVSACIQHRRSTRPQSVIAVGSSRGRVSWISLGRERAETTLGCGQCSARRTFTQEYLDAVNWTDVNHVTQVLGVFERLVHGLDPQDSSKFLNSLRRDGYVIDEETGHIIPIGPRFAVESLNNLTDASAACNAIIDDPGHGQASIPAGLGIRHAHLAVNAVFTWCQLMLDTLADPLAPWRKTPQASREALPCPLQAPARRGRAGAARARRPRSH